MNVNRREFLAGSSSMLLLLGCRHLIEGTSSSPNITIKTRREIEEKINMVYGSYVFIITESIYRYPDYDSLLEQTIKQLSVRDYSDHVLVSYIERLLNDFARAEGRGMIRSIAIPYKNVLLVLDHTTTYKEGKLPIKLGSFEIDIEIADIEVQEESTTLNGTTLEEIANDPARDLAVFKLPRNYDGSRFPFGLGDSDNIYLGQPVYVLGYPSLTKEELRVGIISNRDLSDNKFDVSVIMTRGDSGTACVDYETFSLLGINATANSVYGSVVPINYYKGYI